MPAAIAMVVMTIGRARLRPASMIAVVRGHALRDLHDREIDQQDRVLGHDAHQHQEADHRRQAERLLRDQRAPRNAPPIDSGRDDQDRERLQEVPNSSTSTPSTIMMPAPMAMPKLAKTSS